MLRAPAVGRHQSSIGARHQVVLPELSYLLEHGVSRGSQELPIPRESVVLPVMLCVPGRAGRIPLETPRAENVVFGLHRPAAHIGIVLPRGLGAHAAQAVDVVEKRNRAFGKIGWLRQPVIHLDIDVGVIVAAPRRIAVSYTHLTLPT